jgi:serine/threonine protein kinase
MARESLSHCTILEPIGRGGRGEVYRARDTQLGREVAIKVLAEAFSKDAERLARFEREARLLASLNHPAIATLYGLEQSGEIRFPVMELVPERRSPRESTAVRSLSTKRFPCSSRLPRDWKPRTRRGSSTEI